MKTDKLFYQIFINQPSLIHELLPDIPSDCQFEYSAPVIKDTEFRLDGLLTPLSDNPNVPLVFLEAQMQKDRQFYGRYFAQIFLYLHQYLALLKLIVVENSAVTNLGKSILNSAETEQEFQRRFNLIEAILKSKLPPLTTEEILIMFDLKTAKMPELNAYETLVKYWQDKAKEEAEADLLIRQLIGRFGNLTDNQKEKVRSLSIPELESLGEALLDFQNISDLESWFNNQKFS